MGFGINTGGSPDLTQCPSGTLGILGLGEEASKTCYLGWRDMKMDVSRRLKIMEVRNWYYDDSLLLKF